MHFPVTDFDAEYDRLTKPGIKFDEPPENKPWGWRHTYTHDPAGALQSACRRQVDQLMAIGFVQTTGLTTQSPSAMRLSSSIRIHRNNAFCRWLCVDEKNQNAHRGSSSRAPSDNVCWLGTDRHTRLH